MRCERCNEREAVVSYSTIDGNEMTEMHICQQCLQQLLSEELVHPLFQEPNLNSLFQQILNLFESENVEDIEDESCPECGTTLRDFKETSLLGCSHCYETFYEELLEALPRMQGATTHRGNRSDTTVLNQMKKDLKAQEEEISLKLDNLRMELLSAVEDECYEEAAKLRDKIRELEE